MKQVIIFGLLAFFCYIQLQGSWDHKQKQRSPALQTDTTLQHLPERLVKLPVGENVYYSAAPSAAGITDLAYLGIQVDLRLNGNGNDAGPLIIEDEAEICNNLGLRFYYMNIDGGDDIAHAVQLLQDGNTLVHCKHGAHRAPLVAGCFMLSQGMRYRDVIKVIHWQDIQYSPKYRKYVDILKSWSVHYASAERQL